MDTNGDLGIMSHVGHLRRTPEFVRGLPPHHYEIPTEILLKMNLFRPKPATPSECRAF